MKSLLPFSVLTLTLLLTSATYGQVEILSRFSATNASIFDTDAFASDGEIFELTGTFDGTATVPGAGGSTVTVSQLSTINSMVFDIETFSDAGMAADSFTESISNLFVSFEVTSPVTYTLEGTLTEGVGDTGNITAILEGTGFGGPEVFRFISESNSQINLSETGILPIGTYSFVSDAINLGDTNTGAITSSDITLTFSAVPEPSSLVLLCGFVAAIATRRNRAKI